MTDSNVVEVDDGLSRFSFLLFLFLLCISPFITGVEDIFTSRTMFLGESVCVISLIFSKRYLFGYVWSRLAIVVFFMISIFISYLIFQTFSGISVNPSSTWFSVLGFSSFVFVSFLALEHGSTERGARLIIIALVMSVVLSSCFGFVSWATGIEKTLWGDRNAYPGMLTGPFVNRNSAAIFFGLGAVILFSSGTRCLINAYADGARGFMGRFFITLDQFTKYPGFTFFLVLFLFFCILLTGSRAGFFVDMLGIFFIIFIRRRSGNSMTVFLLFSFVVVSVVSILFFVDNSLMTRVSSGGSFDESRFDVYRATWSAILDRPWFGWGAGTFSSVFPSYRPDSMSDWGVWERAHDIYLDLMLGVGIPMSVFLLFILIYYVSSSWKVIGRRVSGLHYRLYALGCLFVVLLHGLIDFSFENPSIAMFISTLIGLSLARRSDRVRF